MSTTAAEPSPQGCPVCGHTQLFLIVPMAADNPWNWFRCVRCDYRFTPSTTPVGSQTRQADQWAG